MAVTYDSAVKSKRMQSVIDRVDGKTYVASTGSATAGKLVIGTSALSGATGVLVEIPLPVPSFTESGGVIILQGMPLSADAAASGMAATAEVRDSADNTIVSGLTVGTAGTHILIESASIVEGKAVSVYSGTITHG
jgi:hypothetical protein